MKIKSVTLFRSVSMLGDLFLDRKYQFPFIGRSNVGKSSLLNSLINRHVAPVSKAPGRTRKINYYILNDLLYLVDLPGYGYAQISMAARHHWARLIETYLSFSQRQIPFVTVLIDFRHDPGQNDLQLFKWIIPFEIPVQIIFTKMDKVKKAQRLAQQKNQIDTLLEMSDNKMRSFIKQQIDDLPPILYSVKLGQGRSQLWSVLENSLKGEHQ